jgi:hypothetical protein
MIRLSVFESASNQSRTGFSAGDSHVKAGRDFFERSIICPHCVKNGTGFQCDFCSPNLKRRAYPLTLEGLDGAMREVGR